MLYRIPSIANSLKKFKETKTAQKDHENSTRTVEDKRTAIIEEAVPNPPIKLDTLSVKGIYGVVFDQFDVLPTKILAI